MIQPVNKFILTTLLIVLAAPAHATGGLICRTSGSQPIEVAVVISHTLVPVVVSARLTYDGRDIPTRIAQSWLEAGEIRLDLVDLQARQHDLRLRAKLKGRFYDGSIWRTMKRRWVRCKES